MYAGDLDPTKFYALRHPAGLDPPGMIKVRVTSAPRKQKIKICYVEGDLEGLEEWVTTRSLICEWGGRTRIHRDEQRERELAAASALVWDRALEEAINTVFDATGEDICWYKGSCRVSIAVAERLWQRAQLRGEPESEPLAYRDRHGELHLSFSSALKLAQAFAAAEPEPCLLSMRNREEELRTQGFVPGENWAHERLIRTLVPHAVVRQWIAVPATAALESELSRVRYLAHEAIRMLKEAGDEPGAARIKRALGTPAGVTRP